MTDSIVATPPAAGQPPKATGSPWLRFLARRLAGFAAIVFTLVLATFLLLQLIPGDPARAVAGANATPEQVALARARLGLDQPLLTQLFDYVGGLLRGDLGTSFVTGEPVTHVIADRLPFTAQLALFGILLVLLVSVPLGMAVAVGCRGGRRRWLDTGFTSVTAIAAATPEFVLGTFLIVVFSLTFGILPAGGAATPAALILPTLAISVGPIATIARIVRRETAVVLGQDYLRTARGRRLPPLRLYGRHALPNLMTSTLTLGALILASMVGGAVIVELVFNWPGLGSRVINAIITRDFPVIQGAVLVLGILAAVVNVLVDIILGVIDPRTLQGKVGLT